MFKVRVFLAWITEGSTQERVVDILKAWITGSYLGTAHDSLLDDIKAWEQANDKILISRTEESVKPPDSNSQVCALPSIPAPKFTRLTVLDFDPKELAYQITLEEMRLYKKITVLDCLEKVFHLQTRPRETRIKDMLSHGNKVNRSGIGY